MTTASTAGLSTLSNGGLVGVQHFVDRGKRIRIFDLLVFTPARDPGKTNCNTRFVTARALNGFERQLENQLRFNHSHRAKCLDRVIANEPVYLSDFGIGESGISFRKRYKFIPIPNTKCVVCEKIRTLPRTFLRIEQNSINR